MKGISNLFSRISPDVSHIHKSRSYDLTDKGVAVDPSPSHVSGKDSSKNVIGIGDISLHSSSPQLGGRNKRDKGMTIFVYENLISKLFNISGFCS